MPLYNTLVNPPALYPGDVSPNLILDVAEPGDGPGDVGGLNTSGNRSQQVAIARGDNDEGPLYISVELIFSGNPGAFNFQVQECHGTDILGRYVTLATGGTITTAVLSPDGVTYIATVDLEPSNGTHLLLFCSSQTANSVDLLSARFMR